MNEQEVRDCISTHQGHKCPGCAITTCPYSPEYEVVDDDRDEDVHPIIVVDDI